MAARALHRTHGHRYYQWELEKGEFRYFEHPVNLQREKAHEGKYLIQTEEQKMTPIEIVAAYKELNEVERGFAHLKGLFEVRPIHHRTEDRVRAHVFVAALAFLLDRAMEKKLRQAGSRLSSPFAWRALDTVRCVKLELDGHTKLCVTRGSQHASHVLKTLGISKLHPPVPPQNEPTAV